MEMKSLSRKGRSNKNAPGHYIRPKGEINRAGRNLRRANQAIFAVIPRS